jgi:phage-related protein
MAEFAWAESSSSALEEEPRVSRTRYGDGYEESAPDGLNPLKQAWSLQFRRVSREAGDEIIQFFRDRFSAVGGLENFDWTPLWATEPIKVVARNWTRTQLDDIDESDIQVRFERDYRP